MAVDGEIAVEGEEGRAGIVFDHANEAGVGEGHGEVAVGFHEVKDMGHLRLALEIGNDQLAFQKTS